MAASAETVRRELAPIDDQIVTIKRASELRGFPVPAIRKLIADKKLQTIRLGAHTSPHRFWLSHFDRAIDREYAEQGS